MYFFSLGLCLIIDLHINKPQTLNDLKTNIIRVIGVLNVDLSENVVMGGWLQDKIFKKFGNNHLD